MSTESNSNSETAASPFADVIHFRCQRALPAAVKRAAHRKMISASAYVREAIVERLKSDGIDFSSSEAA
jgi:hypothetical protein